MATSLGATFDSSIFENGGTRFRVWAPEAKSMEVKIIKPETDHVLMPLERDKADEQYWTGLSIVGPGAQYFYKIDGDKLFPDPASRLQPKGVHGPSQVIDPDNYVWSRAEKSWVAVPLSEYIIYEMHIGTFTEEGTFSAALEKLPDLVSLGVTAIEIMPVAQFPGERNWGYDGVYPFAVQNSYGGAYGLKLFVDTCHSFGIAVILDVVYNHFGPEGNYFSRYAPYTIDKYKTPWGKAVNFDDAYSDGVRDYFIKNALYWLEEFHIDSLRLDAVHAIHDESPMHILSALSYLVNTLEPKKYLIAESDSNDARHLLSAYGRGGCELDAQWSDDYHHALHVALTGDQSGYYRDFDGVGSIVLALRNRFTYTGQYSQVRKRKHGGSALSFSHNMFVVCSQNHDQVGNQPLGDRLSTRLSLKELKLAAAATILSPFTPLLFMGEEHGETNPFPYFVDHSDEGLSEDVREGRYNEFREFFESAGEEPLDPTDIETFDRAILTNKKELRPEQLALLECYRDLIRIRKVYQLGDASNTHTVTVAPSNEEAFFIRLITGKGTLIVALNFGETSAQFDLSRFGSGVKWRKLLDFGDESSIEEFEGSFTLPAKGVLVYLDALEETFH